ncbi:MAG: thiamine pyrophosphate-dependent dehydrogenase E1 component subunit alpha [Chloroflexi bacterium]|jgi:pyruvate dehydrogenase E1 component alpha subunit|nr:thiamine pyrophosphate-dependent dehydrogenase E1 component subunit alpha [Chloroflexota bacterium]
MTDWKKLEFDNYETTDVLETSARLKLKPNDLIEMYRTMIKIRLFEEMADKQYALGKVHGTMHLSAGQEAVAVGSGFAVDREDYLLNHHRGHGHFIASGADVNKMMAEFLGKETGYCHGRGGSMHIADVTANNLGANGIVGGGLQLAVGVGLAIQMKKKDQVVLTIFGDGAANEGIFHESLNMAAIWDLPILYLCENNQYGMSADVTRVSAKTPFKDRAAAYGIPGYYIDGNDVLAVFETMQKAAGHARSGKGPVFVEAQTYRYFGHSKSDRNLYRTKEEMDYWKSVEDPILRFENLLLKADLITKEKIDQIKDELSKEVDEAVVFAENSPEPDVKNLTEWVYA